MSCIYVRTSGKGGGAAFVSDFVFAIFVVLRDFGEWVWGWGIWKGERVAF